MFGEVRRVGFKLALCGYIRLKKKVAKLIKGVAFDTRSCKFQIYKPRTATRKVQFGENPIKI